MNMMTGEFFSFHSILVNEIYRKSRSMRVRIVGMDDEFLIGLIDLGSTPNGQWTKNISHIMCFIKYGISKQNVNPMKTAESPN
jgi:hypothetical protein